MYKNEGKNREKKAKQSIKILLVYGFDPFVLVVSARSNRSMHTRKHQIRIMSFWMVAEEVSKIVEKKEEK